MCNYECTPITYANITRIMLASIINQSPYSLYFIFHNPEMFLTHSTSQSALMGYFAYIFNISKILMH